MGNYSLIVHWLSQGHVPPSSSIGWWSIAFMTLNKPQTFFFVHSTVVVLDAFFPDLKIKIKKSQCVALKNGGFGFLEKTGPNVNG